MENKAARFFRSAGKLLFFIPLGVILIVFGTVMLKSTAKEYGEVTGSVTGVTEVTDPDGNTAYDVEFVYTVDGRDYSGVFAELAKSYEKGDGITVYYDTADPESITNMKGLGIIAPIMIAAGAVSLVFAAVSLINAIKKNRGLDAAAGAAPDVVPEPKETLREYYVMYDGNTLKPGYTVEDAERNVVFEATMTKNSLVGNRIFTFKNRVTGRTAEHEVGHTVTTSCSDVMFSESSYFKFDGRNVWDVIHERGIRIATDIHSKFPKMIYTLSRNGRFAATVETSSKYVHEEDEARHRVAIPYGRWYYRVWTNETDIDTVFLTVFAISETEQTIVE